MNKLIIYITLLLSITLCYGYNGDLYAITTLGSDASNLNLIIARQLIDQVVLNTTINLPSYLSMQAITNINFDSGVITLLCVTNLMNTVQSFNLIDYNTNTGEKVLSFGKSFESGRLNISSGAQNYIISNQNHIYIVNSLDYTGGIKLVDLYFDNYNTSNIPSSVIKPSKQLFIDNTNDIDKSFTPVGTINIEDNSLVMVYHSTQDPNTVATIVIGNINGSETSSSSSSIDNYSVPTQSYKIKLYSDVSFINQVYTDHMGYVYIILFNNIVCKVDFGSNSCDIEYSGIPSVYTPNLNFYPFLITQNKQSIVSITTNIVSNTSVIEIGTWNYDWQAGYSDLMSNYWLNNLPQSYTYFAI